MAKTFEEAHPEHMQCINANIGGIEGLRKFQHYKGSKVVEQWERDSEGNLVDVTQRVLAEQEFAEAKKLLAKLLQEDAVCKERV